MAGDPESREAMQDRAREAGGLGEFRIDMQRIRIARQPVDQRHFRPGRKIANAVRSALRQRMRRRGFALWSAEAAVAAAERSLRQGSERTAARLVADLALGINQRALACALVHHVQNAGAPDHRALRRDRLMQLEALLAMHHLGPGDAELGLAQPIGRIALYQSEGRQHLEIFFVDEGELVGVERILAETEAERIKHAILRAVAVLDVRDFQRQQFFGFEGHWRKLFAETTVSGPKPPPQSQRSSSAWPIARPRPAYCLPRWRQSRIAARDRAARGARIWPLRRCGA